MRYHVHEEKGQSSGYPFSTTPPGGTREHMSADERHATGDSYHGSCMEDRTGEAVCEKLWFHRMRCRNLLYMY